MATKQKDEKPAARQQDESAARSAAVARQIMHTLGSPGDLQRVDARPLWANHYRVNIYVGEDVASVRVAHSYFVVADGENNIVTVTPAITRQYGA